MAYYSGSAADMSAVRTALVSACTNEGWAWDSGAEVLSHAALGLYLKLQVVSGYLTLLGRTSASSGDAPAVVRVGTLGTLAVTFPVTYEVFVFAKEVYLVIKYSVDYFQWCAFGKSSVGGLAGTGMYVAATGGALSSSEVTIAATSGGTTGIDGSTSAALFWTTVATSGSAKNCFVHHNLDNRGWTLDDPSSTNYQVGVQSLAPLVGLLPNSWNSEAVLLPVRAFAVRPSNLVSMVVDLEHARITRIDNHEPGEIVTLGDDRWKLLPWYRKNATSRNGGQKVSHSGTFGWAIRYEGP